MFKKYMSLKRFGNEEVSGIANGKCYIFPKIDGTNANVWLENGEVYAGSRNRELDESSKGDNGGFCKWAKQDTRIIKFLNKYSDLRLFGEWLIPHSLKTYRDDAWRRFYVFDVYSNSEDRFLRYAEYTELLKEFGIDYVPLLWIMENPTMDKLLLLLPQNNFLIKDGMGSGEGIVIKNYEYNDRDKRNVWGKMITNEFKEKHKKVMGASEIVVPVSIEKEIIEAFFTQSFIEKEYHKMLLTLANNEEEWTNKKIPELLGRIWSEFLKEESYNFIKKFKNPTINFKILNSLALDEIKKTLTNIF